ncbi:GNAT family N-acetyltransferase [Caulobacter mirabilis]|uniref:GNAT family N-acetyltransferase n=1 Tax=Caulobacter mirabilis TaxID=69666 RepID=A0A2D2AZH8_9CAUL|nr:GNAT family N-acetyltransferase [Caulobacter mirabilis]ATQ43391.1 GNAT family N-acetyltransferase [Caulobacter mirabilis]
MPDHAVSIAEPLEGPVERHPVIDTLTLAFSTDPAVRYLFPTAKTFLANFPRLATAMAGSAIAAGTAWSADDGAAALWLAPGEKPDGDALGALVMETVAPERLAVLLELGELMEQHHPDEPHWYLSMVGVDPSRQGQGLGGALLKAGLRRADAEGLPAYLESSSPRNVPLYERHGFEVTGLIKPGDHPGLIPMYRPAR